MAVEQLADQPPRVVVVTSVPTDTVEALLLSVARGNQEAFVALQSRMTGLVLVNIRRVLRDATRSQSVTQETFADVFEDAVHFDPHRDSAQTWLLTRAYQHAIDELRFVPPTEAPADPIHQPVRTSATPDDIDHHVPTPPVPVPATGNASDAD